jgi:hypothetical protein
MENNMKSLIKKYWWAILIVLALPIIANYIVLCPSIAPIAGESKDWLNFLAVYFSGLIAAFVSFSILYKTIETNNIENSKNRNLQVRTIEYQTEIQWINNLKSAIQEVYNAFNILWLDEIYLIFKNTDDYNNADSAKIVKEKIKQLCNKVNLATDNFRLTIVGRTDSEEVQFSTDFDELRSKFCNVVSDISALSEVCFHNGTDDSLKSQFEKAISDHKDKCTSTEDDSERLWAIANNHEMKLKSHKAQIVKDLIDAYHPIFMYDWCKNVLQYETEKANKILNGNE